MKAIVMSDSHGDRDIVADVVQRYRQQVDAIIHCGDSELSADDPLTQQLLLVQGNMDLAKFDTSIRTTLDNIPILIVHGHLLGVNQSLLTLNLEAQQQQVAAAFFGHTHQLMCQVVKGCLLLNPGSITYPRGQYAPLGGTYASVSITPTKFQVQYYTRRHEPVLDLAFNWSR